jgi:uncharacterized protein YprB with RNaseH-like and TPR domain
MSNLGLKEKLRELERVQNRTRTPGNLKPKSADLEALLGGEEREGCFVVERRYALQEEYGPVRLSDFLDITGAALSIAAKDNQLAEFDPRNALFLDTETTGLAGGTGTIAFLVGLGYFENEEFVVRQYFLRGPQEESTVLTAVLQHVRERRGLVTFNGKSFDIPLLLTRSILNRLPPPFDMLPHIDVLHAARRMWKQRLQDCSLGNLEFQILGMRRSEDVPGSLIPSIYFDFLRTGNTRQLPEIFAHNRQDLVTTAALLTYLGALVQSPFKLHASLYELRQIGRLYREAGEWETSARTFEALIERHGQDKHVEDYLALGFCYKSQRRYQEARRIWEHMIDHLPLHPLPFIELAKHLEHRDRDHQRAHDLAQRGLRSLALLEELQPTHEFLIYRADLLRRAARLERKLRRA